MVSALAESKPLFSTPTQKVRQQGLPGLWYGFYHLISKDKENENLAFHAIWILKVLFIIYKCMLLLLRLKSEYPVKKYLSEFIKFTKETRIHLAWCVPHKRKEENHLREMKPLQAQRTYNTS